VLCTVLFTTDAEVTLAFTPGAGVGITWARQELAGIHSRIAELNAVIEILSQDMKLPPSVIADVLCKPEHKSHPNFQKTLKWAETNRQRTVNT
jgi:hypothetical protein